MRVFTGHPELDSVHGQLFRHLCHKVLAAGGSFRVYPKAGAVLRAKGLVCKDEGGYLMQLPKLVALGAHTAGSAAVAAGSGCGDPVGAKAAAQALAQCLQGMGKRRPSNLYLKAIPTCSSGIASLAPTQHIILQVRALGEAWDQLSPACHDAVIICAGLQLRNCKGGIRT